MPALMQPPPPPPSGQMPATPIGWLCFYLVCAWLVISILRLALRVGRHIRACKLRKARAEVAYVVMIPSIHKD